MSSAKRRRKKAIERLIKLDTTYSRLYLYSSPKRDADRSWSLWMSVIVPLGDKLERQKPGAWHSLPRKSGGPDILMHCYRERNGLPDEQTEEESNKLEV